MIIDTHCHLDDKRYFDDIDEVISRAKEQGVKGFLIAGAHPKDLKRAEELSKRFDTLFYSVGIHPNDAETFDIDILKRYYSDKKCIAIGECGLDYHYLPDGKEEQERNKKLQKDVFRRHIEFSIEVDKPLIVHIRESSSDSLEILREYPDARGVLHCYNASPSLLELSDRFYYGIGGVVTFKNAKKLIDVFSKIPKDRLLIETDCPYLTPHPHRGERNEPSYTTLVAKKMSELLDMSYDEVCDLTTKNTQELFKEFI
jgi:TatD DNase family protein